MRSNHYYCLFAPHIYGCCSSCISRLWWIAHSTQHHCRGCNNILSFLQSTALITCSFHEVWTWPDLQILPTAPLSCDRKARAPSAQSFTLWQQATLEIMRRNHSSIACLHHIIYAYCYSRISRSWWIAHPMQCERRDCSSTSMRCNS